MNDNLDFFKKYLKKYNLGGENPLGLNEVEGIDYTTSVFSDQNNIFGSTPEFDLNLLNSTQKKPMQAPPASSLNNERTDFDPEKRKLIASGTLDSQGNPKKDDTSKKPDLSKDDLKQMLVNGVITEEEYNKRISEIPQANNAQKLLSRAGRGFSLENALFSLGQSLAYDGEERGANALRGISSAGKVALAGARNLTSGYGFQNRTQETQKTYEERLRQDRRNNVENLKVGGEIEDPLVEPLSMEDSNIDIISRDYAPIKLELEDFETQLPEPDYTYSKEEEFKYGGMSKEDSYKKGGVVYRDEILLREDINEFLIDVNGVQKIVKVQ